MTHDVAGPSVASAGSTAVALRPYYEKDGITIYHGDCRTIYGGLQFDAIVSDPPYGMNYTGHSGKGNLIHSKGGGRNEKAKVSGDDRPFDVAEWLAWPCVFSGATWYYDRLPPGGSLHSWDKRGEYKRTSFADCDIIWCSRKIQSQTFRLVWRGLCRHAENKERIVHPTQKPVELMRWMIGLVGVRNVETVLDPFMGSGSTLLAARAEGLSAVGIEIEERYCEIAAKRLSQGVLF